jgi:hypothetical protein
MRDVQLIEAKKRKEQEAQVQRVKELELVNRLRQEIDDEKETKLNKRKVEREQALKVILDNENAKVKLIQEKEKEREAENKTIEDYNKMLELQEAKRQNEWKRREGKIQLFMNRMADTVKKSND